MLLWVGIVALILIVSITAGIAGVLLRGRENDIKIRGVNPSYFCAYILFLISSSTTVWQYAPICFCCCLSRADTSIGAP